MDNPKVTIIPTLEGPKPDPTKDYRMLDMLITRNAVKKYNGLEKIKPDDIYDPNKKYLQ